MVSTSGIEFELEVANVVRRIGYDVKAGRASFVRPRYVPDLIIGRLGKHVAVETKARPLMLSDVFQISRYKQKGLRGKLLCVPQLTLNMTPMSVRSYAKQMDVQICGIDDIPRTLNSILS